jgi:hypothetical protein
VKIPDLRLVEAPLLRTIDVVARFEGRDAEWGSSTLLEPTDLPDRIYT